LVFKINSEAEYLSIIKDLNVKAKTPNNYIIDRIAKIIK